MFQTKSKWKLGALLLVAPLLMPAVARADTNENYDAAQIRDILKGYKWQSADGEIYIFRKDGQFERRHNPSLAMSLVFTNDFGRFTVRPVRDSDEYVRDENFILQLNITSSLKRPTGRNGKATVVLRNAIFSQPIKIMAKATVERDASGSDPYAMIGNNRFNWMQALG